MSRTFTGAEFVKAIADGEIRSAIVLEGMAKPAENGIAAIMFSPSGCDNWVQVPVEIIESVEHLGQTPCNEHDHPHVRIHLLDSATKSPEGIILAAILKGRYVRENVPPTFKPQPQPWRDMLRSNLVPLSQFDGGHMGVCHFDETIGRCVKHYFEADGEIRATTYDCRPCYR